MHKTHLYSKWLFFGVLLNSASPLFAREGQPNILTIITDQQRYDALQKVGNFDFLRTPVLDRLAEEGVYFSRAYTPCAVSGPARCALLTGLLVENNGVNTNEITTKDPIVSNLTTLPTIDQLLVQNGYYSEYIGKWHAPIGWAECYSEFGWEQKGNNPYAYQTEHFSRYGEIIKEKFGDLELEEGELIGGVGYGVPYKPSPIDRRYVESFDEHGNQHELPKGVHMPHADNHGMLTIPEEYSLTAFQAKEAIAALKRAEQQDKPFAITLSINYPHAPMIATPTYYNMYNVEDMPIPQSIGDKMVDSPYKDQNGRLRLTEYADGERIQHMMATYFGLISEIDYWVGEVLKTVNDIGVEDNTIIVFMSDHGEMLGAHGMREKNVFFEESARVPLIIKYPGEIEPAVVDREVTTLDIFATLLDYTNISENATRNSRSLRGVIEGNDNQKDGVVTEWLYHGIDQPSHMIVKGDWKLFFNYSPESKVVASLFNLRSDPYEMTNLIGKSNINRDGYIAIADDLREDMISWLNDRGSEMVESIKKVQFE